MNRTRYIFRAVFFLVAVALLVNINRKTDEHVKTIAEFKFNMFEKLRKDSLDSRQKLDLLFRDTKKFIDNSSHVRTGINYLIGLFGLFVVVEMSFLILDRRGPGR